jgi:predicted metal-dependent enzyme (double-stranded beta helix superfamily)
MNAHAIAPITTRFTSFVTDLSVLVEEGVPESELLARGGRLLGDLIAHDDWLPGSHAAPDPARYRQYLLYRDPADRFSVVSFVWGPGQATPVHDHRTWGLVGVLRGAELVETFRLDEEGALRPRGPVQVLDTRQIDIFSPRIGDIHRVANAYDNKVSISIHVYGADIGKVNRATYDRAGRQTPFVSSYAPVEPLLS